MLKCCLFSEEVIRELLVYFDEKVINDIFEVVRFEGLLFEIDVTFEHKKEAKELVKIRKLPFGDCLHDILARDNNAILVTRDKPFYELNDIVEIRKPEELN